MKEFNVTFTFDINGGALREHNQEAPYPISGERIRERNVTIIPTNELTDSEHLELKSYIETFDNFSQRELDIITLRQTKKWGRSIIEEFELRNMNRKRKDEMGRVELHDIFKESVDSLVLATLAEGSLDTLHGIIYGFPQEGEISAKAPYTFSSVSQEDIDWIKSELNQFLSKI